VIAYLEGVMMTLKRLEPTEVDVEPTLAVQVDGACGPGMDGLPEAMTNAFSTLGAYLSSLGITPSGPPRAIYTVSNPEGSRFVVAFPIAALPAGKPEAGPVRVGELPGGKTLCFSYYGAYSGLPAMYAAITEWLKQKGMIASERDWDRFMPMWEEYLGDPSITPPDELLTCIYLPIGG
jgi:effector-binding domain-containing protein